MAWDDTPPDAPAAGGWDSTPPDDFIKSTGSPDLDRIRMSFSDPATRAGLEKMAFTQHPINWLESHAGDALPAVGMGLGAAGGGAAAGALGIPTGPGAMAAGYAGSVAGAGMGAAAGESAREALGRILGVNRGNMSPDALWDAAKTGAEGEAIGKPVVGAIGAAGRNAYDSMIQPVLKAGGERAGDVLRKAGIMTATDLPAKADAAREALYQNTVKPLVDEATQKGAVVPVSTMTGPLDQLATKLRGIRSPEAQSAADQAVEKSNYFKQQVQGTPAVPPTPASIRVSPIVDSSGKPFETQIAGSPGQPAIAGQPYTPAEAAGVKTNTPFSDPNNKITPIDDRVLNAQRAGSQKAVEDAVEQTLGPKAAAQMKEANLDQGSLISSEGAQHTAAENYAKLKRGLTSLRGTDALAASGGGALGEMAQHPVLGALAGVLAKKGFDAARVAQMPAGYLMDKFATSPAMSNAAIAGATSPWFNLKKDKQPVAGVGR